MNAKTERTLAGLTVGALLLMWFGVFLQVYYVPILMADWERTGAALSSGQRLLATVASFTSQNFLAVGSPLLAVTILATIWRIRTIWKARRCTPS